MATTKKSPKAKTKTTKASTKTKNTAKKPAGKASKTAATRAASAKAKQSVAKSAKVAKPAQKTTKLVKKATEASPLRKLHQLSAFLHVVGAVAAAVLMGSATLQFFTGLTTKDELASSTSTIFVPAIHHLYDLEIRWIVVTLLVLGAIMPLMRVFRQNRYQAVLKAKSNPLRWADKAILSGAMLMVVAALSGVEDVMTLKVIGGLIVVTAALGWLAERQNANPKASPDRAAYTISLLSGALPWLIILAYAFGTPLWGMVRYPWYVYALYVSVLISGIAYALNGSAYIRRLRSSYEVVERNYLIIDIFARVSFAIILIVGFAK